MSEKNASRDAGVIDKKLGNRIRARRLEIGMSQERLAKLLGVTFQQVQKYEKGINRVAIPRFVDMCKHLECSYEELLDGISGGSPKHARFEDTLSEGLANPTVQETVRVMASLTNKQRQAVLVNARAYKED